MTVHQIEEQATHLHLPAAATADICDANPGAKFLQTWFQSYGGKRRCSGPVEIISTRDDNSLVKSVLAEPGAGRILLVDNQSSTNCAMVGGGLAQLAADKGWIGIVVNGAVRDADELKNTEIAVFALATCPRKSMNRGIGERNRPVRIGGERIHSEDLLVADSDGVVVLSAWNAMEA
ncbi:MAG: ribonuclease E activity regulator RraA [Woeseiaceae bacterium]